MEKNHEKNKHCGENTNQREEPTHARAPTHRLHTAHEVHGVYNTCSTDKVIFLLIETERRKIPEISLSGYF